jgi:hypothetical protein
MTSDEVADRIVGGVGSSGTQNERAEHLGAVVTALSANGDAGDETTLGIRPYVGRC